MVFGNMPEEKAKRGNIHDTTDRTDNATKSRVLQNTKKSKLGLIVIHISTHTYKNGHKAQVSHLVPNTPSPLMQRLERRHHRRTRRMRRTIDGARIRPGNGHRVIRLLARRSGLVLGGRRRTHRAHWARRPWRRGDRYPGTARRGGNHVRRRRRRVQRRTAVEAALALLRRVAFRRRRRQRKWLGRRRLRRRGDVPYAFLRGGDLVDGRRLLLRDVGVPRAENGVVAAHAGSHGALEAGRVGRGLRAELREVEVRARRVPLGHGLAQTPLRVEAVEDHAVDEDGDDLDDDLDEAADERPVLQAAHEVVVDVLLEDGLARIVLAAPAPDVVAAGVVLGRLQRRGADAPHDDGEGEKADGEDGVVDCGFLGAAVAPAGVAVEDHDGHKEGEAGDAEEEDGGPFGGVLCRWCEGVAGWEAARGVEDGEGGGEHAEDDERTGEVGEAEGHFGDPHADFDALRELVLRLFGGGRRGGLPGRGLVLCRFWLHSSQRCLLLPMWGSVGSG